ncbi:MAG TPA: sulfite dehydrogenase [Burkholderiales bacterium]|nr:sulfite dehydrogenase [Burkholderiales bacterium]
MGRKIQSPRAPQALPPSGQSSDGLPAKIDRRGFLARGAGIAGAAAAGIAPQAAAQDATAVPPWMQTMGTPMRGYGNPSKFEEKVLRVAASGYAKVTPGAGASRTPLQALEGTITPSGLHFERHHNGVPTIDPAQHRLMIHGLVKKPLVFTVESLERYPMTSRICFVECAGNSGPNTVNPKPPQATAQAIHGLVSCSEWTGVPLALLLNEAGVEAGADWLLAEGADAAAMGRSVPLAKGLDDAMLALYQNGERLRPEQGYPVRLLLPGWEGNMNVKWLRRIKVTRGPTHTKDETSKYSDMVPGGKALQFTFAMGVKSVITRPSFGGKLAGPGFHEVSGIAWSGAGRIRRVDVTLDGGATWKEAVLQGPILSRSLTRFRLPWDWNGGQAVIASRAVDEKGSVQPTRAAWLAEMAQPARYHNHSIQAWEVAADGSIANVFI